MTQPIPFRNIRIVEDGCTDLVKSGNIKLKFINCYMARAEPNCRRVFRAQTRKVAASIKSVGQTQKLNRRLAAACWARGENQ